MIGYDDVASTNYFSRFLPAYYARNGKTITQAVVECHDRHDEIFHRCAKFGQALLCDAREKGGEEYALILAAAYRKRLPDTSWWRGLMVSCCSFTKKMTPIAALQLRISAILTMPLFLLYCPELVRAMCRPIFKFAKMPV